MTTFDEREQGFERKFAHDEELSFKATARRNKLVGLWAAEKLGKTGDTAEQYAKDLVLADFENSGKNDIVQKLLKDFAEANVEITAAEINHEMDRLLSVARVQIIGNAA